MRSERGGFSIANVKTQRGEIASLWVKDATLRLCVVICSACPTISEDLTEQIYGIFSNKKII